MTETLIDIDDELLDEAATILGTSSIKDTVNAALADVLGGARSKQRPVIRPQRVHLLAPR
jgi:Arc/MetJ family transcription regulator